MDDGARSAISGLKDRLDAIDVHVNRLTDGRATEGERARSLKGVSAMVEDLARELDNADERARSLDRRAAAVPQPQADTGFDRINDAIRDLDERILSMGSRHRTAAPPRRSSRRRSTIFATSSPRCSSSASRLPRPTCGRSRSSAR